MVATVPAHPGEATRGSGEAGTAGAGEFDTAAGGDAAAGDSSAGNGGSAPLDTSVLPYCLANATTQVSMVANVDSAASVPARPFDIEDPANTSSFSMSFIVEDSCGRPQNLDIYFATAGSIVYFHVITVATPSVELCSGSLLFDKGALVSVIRTKPCQLPSGEVFALNLGTPTDVGGSGIDGVMHLNVPSQVTKVQTDGNASEVGVACTPDQKRSTSTPASCTGDATRVLGMVMNLSTHEPLQTTAWSASWPAATSNVHLRFGAQETRVENAQFDFYLRRETAQSWTYHVLLAGLAAPLELANGVLQFDPLGRLLMTSESQPLRFPYPDGSYGDLIAFDFGTSVTAGGNGVDGLTNFTTETAGYGGGGQLPSDSPVSMPWGCAGLPTHAISEWWVLPSNTLQDPRGSAWSDTPAFTTTAYDTQGTAWALALFWHASGVNQAEYKLVASLAGARIESTVGSLLFNAKGKLQHVDRASPIRLPLADGNDGPGFALDIGATIDEGGQFNAISESDYDEVDLSPDGFAASTPCP